MRVGDSRFFEKVRQSVFREADAAAHSQLSDINDSVDTTPTYQIEEFSLGQTFITDCHYLNHIKFPSRPRATIIEKPPLNATENLDERKLGIASEFRNSENLQFFGAL